MNIPQQLKVSDQSNHIIFSDATPSQLKSKGESFNRGAITTVDNLLTNLTIQSVQGATGRGSSSVTFYIDCLIGRASNQVKHVLAISSDDMLDLLSNSSVHNKVLEGEYILVFNKLTFTVKPYTDELLKKTSQKQQLKEQAKSQDLLERKQLRVTNQELINRTVIGDIISVNGTEVAYAGYGYFTYLQTIKNKEPRYITKKSHAVIFRYKIYDTIGTLRVALIDLANVTLGLTGKRFTLQQELQANTEQIKQLPRIFNTINSSNYHERKRLLNTVKSALALETIMGSLSQNKVDSLYKFQQIQSSIQFGRGNDPQDSWREFPGMIHLKTGRMYYIDSIEG